MAERDKEGSGAIDNVADYRKRVEHYQKVYEPIDSGHSEDDHESEFSYIKSIDHGTKMIEGYMVTCRDELLSSLPIAAIVTELRTKNYFLAGMASQSTMQQVALAATQI